MSIEKTNRNNSALEQPADLFSLKDRVGIVVGGAGKMAQQFNKTLAHAGATVIVADLPDGNERSPAKTARIDCDVSDSKQVQSLFKTVYQIYGRIDFMIFGVMAKPEGYYRSTEAYLVDTWDQVLRGNLTGAFMCCREAGKYMAEKQQGAIVLVSSIYGIVGPDQRIYEDCSPVDNIYGGTDPICCPAVYSASKSGIIGLTRYFATLWGSSNIRVNAMTPGGVFDGQEQTFREAYEHRTPLKRMAVWADFNGAILFLISDASRYMTGANLVIDGGWTAW